jgi:Fic family protein
MFNPMQAHNQLPPLPPKANIETKDILKRWGLARAALAELRLAGQAIPDQSVLISAIPLLEAKDSSEIENIVTTNDDLFREASLEIANGNPGAKEALRYRSALYYGLDSIKQRPLSTRTAIEICQRVTGVQYDVRANPVTLTNKHTRDIIYTPPQGEPLLRELLSNWEAFQHSDSDGVDPLIRMAILHYQFEAIHPFADGNGRTGRILNVVYLVQSGLLDLPTLYLSRHILKTRGEYYSALERVTSHGEWERWIIYMLNAVETTSQWTTNKIGSIRRLQLATNDYVRTQLPKIHSRDLVDVLFAQPYCRIANVVDRGIAKRQAASTYLQALVKIGVLREEKIGREKVFLHQKYFDLLNDNQHAFEPYGEKPKSATIVGKAPTTRGR